jgi:hypothetical protein
MTDTDVDLQDVCPICGSPLVPRATATYCPSCDLTFEKTDLGEGDGGDSGSGSSRDGRNTP